jgi:hypothetical protein
MPHSGSPPSRIAGSPVTGPGGAPFFGALKLVVPNLVGLRLASAGSALLAGLLAWPVALMAGPGTAAAEPGNRAAPERAPGAPEGGRLGSDRPDPLTFHGYGEMHVNLPETGTMDDTDPGLAEFHRFVLGWSYEFSSDIRFDAEVDFEHNASEIELEYAQLEIDLARGLSFRAGSLLMPVGPLNEVHEPPNFYSVERPYLEQSLIPTTWMENGAGLSLRTSDGTLAGRAYLVAGLDAAGFGALDGLRGGRTKGVESSLEDAAGVGRVELVPRLGEGLGRLALGASGYFGEADQGRGALETVEVTVIEADARYEAAGVDLKGEVVTVSVDGAGRVSALAGETVGERMLGWLVEAGVRPLRTLAPGFERELVLFGRLEMLDTHDEVPDGYARDPATKRTIGTLGLAYHPHHRVALKGDLELWEDDADDTVSRVNLGFGFMF